MGLFRLRHASAPVAQSVLRWPSPEQVMAALQAWATEQRLANPGLKRVGVFGSYGRGTAAVGSDLDLLLVDASAEGPHICGCAIGPWSACRSAATRWC